MRTRRDNMKKMKICIFSRALPQWSIGGVETRVYEMSKRLIKNNCDIHIICDKNYYPGTKDYINLDGLHIHFIKSTYSIYCSKPFVPFFIDGY